MPPYLEVRKPAPMSYRPAKAHRERFFTFMDMVREGKARLGVTEFFDLQVQERVAAVVAVIEGTNGESSFFALAIIHNGNYKDRLVPCCVADGVSIEEWDKLPCYVATEGN